MGFNKDRGDSLNVTNSNFTVPTKEVIPEEPFWKPYANIETAKSAGQYLLSFIAMLYLFFKFLKPMLKKLTDPPLPSAAERYNKNETSNDDGNSNESARNNEPNLNDAIQLANTNPRVVANVVKNWVNE